MRWRVVSDGMVRLHEVKVVGDTPDLFGGDPGLTLSAGKEILAGPQRHLVQAQRRSIASLCPIGVHQRRLAPFPVMVEVPQLLV